MTTTDAFAALGAVSDTIAALATAPGRGGIAVIRVSGPGALAVADAVFRGARRLAAVPSHTIHHGRAVDAGGAPLDEVLAAVFRAPRSYTREDVVELSCHGGAIPAGRVLEALHAAGARRAGPGEFTFRAFLNGRLDLAQAEAVADVIEAETRAAQTLALSQLTGALSLRLERVAARLRRALAEVEARVDFAEDVGGVEVPARVVESLHGASRRLDALLAGAAWARAVREGVRVPIVGRPNAGKSSLFNALLGEERAIVTPVPGTTRDRVSEAIELAGVRVTLSDTAGLRDATDPVEAHGIARTREALRGAALVLWVVDGAAPPDPADRAIAADLPGRVVVALNKCDLGCAVTPAAIGARAEWPVVAVSARTAAGVPALREAMVAALGGGGVAAAAANPRHVEALERARAALSRAIAAGAGPGELVALELRLALGAIGEVTGRGVGEDLLDRIFARFCVGK